MNNPFEALARTDKIAVISHINPDGDSLGSTMGLTLALRKRGFQATAFVNDLIPVKFRFLPEMSTALRYDQEEEAVFDHCFVVDCGDRGRLGYSQVILERSRRVVNIDHHISNTHFGDLNLVDPEASSTSEIIHRLVTEALQAPLDEAIATCLYTGIITDTGDFRYERSTGQTHRIAAQLLDAGADLDKIVYHVHQSQSYESLKLLAALLTDMEIHFDGRLTLMKVPASLLAAYGVAYDEVDGMINYARDIEGVEVAVILKELNEREIKVSLRSKTDFNVSSFASQFGGGGHRRAAGAVLPGPMEAAQSLLLDRFKTLF